ncbi:TPA: hypothetical protein I9063_002936 [Clostridium perfringens]|uniref:Uncharacterized protein n=1 Tax=Clostridium perfringens TaxID=1502 RepID=A0AAN5NE53_CLOPF|nr:hypothetical protein [Clostridium perfringens]HAT4218983.1 hypothetical protein [Clostridium perfringens]HAT4299532.1 hypothetical protein [Clostridium perfringens]
MIMKRIAEIENLEKGNTYLDCIVEFFEDYTYKNIVVNNNDEILDLDDNNRVVGKLKDFVISIGKTRKGMGEINA